MHADLLKGTLRVRFKPSHQVCADDSVVQVHTKPRPILHPNVPVLEPFGRGQDLGSPRSFSPLELEETKVPQHRTHLNAGRGRDWTARVVRRHRDTVAFSSRGNSGQFE